MPAAVLLSHAFVEFCRFSKFNKENIDQYIEWEGWEHFKRAYREGKGLFVITAHFGNWELMATAIALRGCTSNIVVRPLDNPYLDKLVTKNRTRFGNNILPKKKALKEILRCLKHGEIVAMLMDQSTASNEAVSVNFFGHPCYTLVTLAMLALKTDCAVLAAFMIRQGQDKHKIIFTPTVTFTRSDDRQHDLEVNTRRLNDIIEEYVRCYPDNWLWAHRRWKF